MRRSVLPVVFLASLVACTDKDDAEFRTDVSLKMHASITEDLQDLARAAGMLQSHAPSRAWDPSADKAAIIDMQNDWKSTRIAWEHVEGAVAPVFPGFNVALDARYEDFLIGLRPGGGDRNLFDGTGVVGMHAIERILFAHEIRPEIVATENALPGYKPAGYPATDSEAIAFKTQLVQRLIDDTNALIDAWQPEQVDISAAYIGLVGLMSEQREKVNLAVTGEEESRYANITLFDLRNNLDGTKKAYEKFREWILAKAADSSDRRILDRFTSLMEAYYTTNSDSLPAVPVGWSSDHPTADNLNTPFGALWMQIRDSVDPSMDGSVVFEMNRVATVLGFSPFIEQ
jgi:iron uptake system component EfeO